MCSCVLLTLRYVWLGANSSFKAESDLLKYEKARKLKLYIDDIRKNYKRDWDSSDVRKKQVSRPRHRASLSSRFAAGARLLVCADEHCRRCGCLMMQQLFMSSCKHMQDTGCLLLA